MNDLKQFELLFHIKLEINQSSLFVIITEKKMKLEFVGPDLLSLKDQE